MTERTKLRGRIPETLDGSPDNAYVTEYAIGNGETVMLTDADVQLCDLYINKDLSKLQAYSSIHPDTDHMSQSANNYFNVSRRIIYCNFLRENKVIQITPSISDFVNRITTLITVTPHDLINPLEGYKDFYELDETVLSACKVRVKYDNLGKVKETQVDTYTMNDIMTLLSQLEEIDETLAAKFKTELRKSQPNLKRYGKESTDV